MKEQCLDEGTFQAFLDGELSSELLETVVRHLSDCDDCSLLLQEIEGESEFAFNLLDDELNNLVPTERIRTNLYQAISEIEKPRKGWALMAAFFAGLRSPTLVAFASLAIVFGVFALMVGLNQKTSVETPLMATNSSPIKPIEKPFGREITSPAAESKTDLTAAKEIRKPQAEKIAYRSEPEVQKKRTSEPKIVSPKPKRITAEPAAALEGENVYLKTIATLENSIKDKKDAVLRASSRISFERDMAVVEDSIKRMRVEVRRNPKNEAAKQILRNSYQNKIELLNSVTERSEFMATLE